MISFESILVIFLGHISEIIFIVFKMSSLVPHSICCEIYNTVTILVFTYICEKKGVCNHN